MKKSFGIGASLCAVIMTMIAPISSVQAQVFTQRYIELENNCRFAIMVWVQHADGWRNWHVNGPFTLQPYQSVTRIQDNGILLTQRDDHVMYNYAYAPGVDLVWQGEYDVYHGQYRLPMRPVPYSTARGTYHTSYTCE